MPQSSPRSSPIYQRLRPRRTRTKTGCQQCRLRRKKCDELKPICSGCSRNHLICSMELDSLVDDSQTEAQALSDVKGSKSSKIVAHPRSGSDARVSKRLIAEAKSYDIRAIDRSDAPWSLGASSEIDQSMNLTLLRQPYLAEVSRVITSKDPASRMLFEHYVRKTAELLSVRRGVDSPFVTLVIPPALDDSMIMDSVLALGGAHLCYSSQDEELKSISITHYMLAIRQLKHEMTRVHTGEVSDPSRIILTILLLSTAEAISGDSQGSIFHHLRASGRFIPQVLAQGTANSDPELRAFLLEIYAYMVCVANITANASPTYLGLVLAPCITGLNDAQFCQASGLMFGYAQDLITLIPEICALGYDRILEDKVGTTSFESTSRYQILHSKVENWQQPSACGHNKKDADLWLAAKIYKEAILIFLHAAFYASNVTDPKFLGLVSLSLSKTVPFVDLDDDSAVLSVMLWPAIIIGSCLEEPIQREILRQKMLQPGFNMAVVLKSIQLLDWLWADDALDSYGPYGLGNVMRKRGIIHSMS